MSEASDLYRDEMKAATRQKTVADAVSASFEAIGAMADSMQNALKGRRVVVLSDHNGQPHGRSRPSWKGEVCRIKSVYIDLYNGISLCLEEHEYECYIPADEVTFELPTFSNDLPK